MLYKLPWIRVLVFSVLVNLPPLAASASQSPIVAYLENAEYLGMVPCAGPCERRCEIIYEQQQIDTCQVQADVFEV